MLIPFASLLNFPAPDHAQLTDSGKSLYSDGEGKARTIVPPQGSFLTSTSNHPAPSSFLPWHYGRQYIRAGGSVVWLSCNASGEPHVRSMLRKSIAGVTSGKRTSGRDSLICIDAAEILLGTEESTSKSGTDARPALWRLQHTLEQTLQRLRDVEESAMEEQSIPAPIIVIVDDASMLAWLIEQLSDDSMTESGSGTADKNEEDPRMKLLRSKRRQGKFAIHRDTIGERLGEFFCNDVFADVCVSNGASLLVQIATDNTSIFPPASRTPASRGGSYGVGTGFDADDAGEENEEDELYEEHNEQWSTSDGKTDEQAKQLEQDTGVNTEELVLEAQRVAAAGIDWRIDSLLRRILLSTDVWIETRGLRSGKARDCHGEICCHGLLRPCLARDVPLPELPLPGDVLLSLRGSDRSVKPLTLFSQLSLSSATATTSRNSAGKDAEQSRHQTNLKAFKIESLCEGRKAAMLYRVEPSGEVVAWSRGGG